MSKSLRTLLAAGFNTLNRELTWEEADTNFIELLQLIQSAGSDALPDVAAYDPDWVYQPGENPTFVTYLGNLYENIAIVEHHGVTPGTDIFTWKLSSVGALSHQQNTDVKLKAVEQVITPDTVINLVDYSSVNILRIKRATGSITYDIALEGVIPAVLPSAKGQLFTSVMFIVIDDADNNTYNFVGGDFISKAVGGNITLTKNQFVVVKGVKTSDTTVDVFEVYSSKDREAGTGGNPFDQSLNPTDSPTFQALTLAQQSGDEGRVFVTGALGQVTTRAGFKVNPASAPTNPNTLVILEHIYSPSWVGAEGAGDKALIVGENGKTKKEDLTPFSSIVLTSFKMIDNLGDTYTVSIVAGTLTLTKDA